MKDPAAHRPDRPVPSDRGEDGVSPLSLAVSTRDRTTMDLVHEAVRRDRVVLAFQPVIQTARPDRPAFYESLLRVIDPGGRIIPARDFMPVVAETELGRKLDMLALKHALETLARVPELRLSVNLSARSIAYPGWNHELKRGLATDPTVAERLILEITEQTAITVPDLVQVFMTELQLQGISFALDDFGAGFTSLKTFKDLYFDILKIDGSYIRDIANTPDNQVMVSAMLSLAQHFEMFTVAEAVETDDEAQFLAEIGVDCMQGYYFGAPTIRPYWQAGDPRERMIA